jgi:hypothetical protein
MDDEMREHLDRMMTEMNRGFERLIDRMSLTAIQARNAPRRDDPQRELLVEVAGYIANLEEGLSSGGTSQTAKKLRRLIAEVSEARL